MRFSLSPLRHPTVVRRPHHPFGTGPQSRWQFPESLAKLIPDGAQVWVANLRNLEDPAGSNNQSKERTPAIPWGYFHRPDVMQRLGYIRKQD